MRELRVQVSHLNSKKTRRFGALRYKAILQTADLRRISVLHIRLEAGARAPALCHRRTGEFFYVLQGSLRGRINDKEYRFKQGSFCFLPPGAIHQFHAGKSGARTLDIFFPRLDLKKPDIVLA